MPSRPFRGESGFSLIELLVATGVLMLITGIVTGALMQMTQAQTTIWNRTEMHSGIRGATELMQQEVGQAGRVTVPGGFLTLSAALTAPLGGCDFENPSTNASTIQVSSVEGLFASTAPAAYEFLTTMDGDKEETIKLASIDAVASTITACFSNQHAANTVLMPLGSFAEGIVPPSVTNGSSGTILKMFGDINGDGNMVYVEYTCDTVAHNLYRNVMAFDAGSKPAVTNSQILLSNIQDNPGSSPCFTYETSTIVVDGTPYTFVLDVAITLTVQTEQIDPITRDYQTETKALLNVSPRNVFNAWALAGVKYTDRIQPTPATVTALLPPVS